MTFRPEPHAGSATVSRRWVLSRVAAATSATLLAPISSTASRALAQTSVATPVAPLPSTLAADASPRFRAVAEALLAAMRDSGTPGAALGILADGREEHASFGVKSIDTGEPVTADTLFQTGSITKTVTGTAVMRLMDDGAIDLEATVRTYLPDLRLQDEAVAERVTVRHLLTHTGGWWGDLFADTGTGDDAIARYVAEWFPELPQFSPLGEYFSYNNAGFILLGQLIEAVTGQDYRAAVTDLVLDPLGVDGSFFAPDEVLARPHALGHFSAEGDTRVQEPLFLPRASDPAGGLWSTTADLLRYARFHLGDGTADGARILSQETLEMMQTPQQAIVGDPTSAMGLPWFIVDLPGQRLVLHDGGTFGQHAQFWLAPDRDFALALFANALPAGAMAAQAALAAVLNEYFELDLAAAQASAAMATPMASPKASPPPAIPSPAELEQYAGQYATPDATYHLTVVDGALVLSYELHPHPAQVQPTFVADVPPEVPIQFVAPDLALVTIAGLPLPLVFVRNADGEVGWIAASLRLIPKVGAS